MKPCRCGDVFECAECDLADMRRRTDARRFAKDAGAIYDRARAIAQQTGRPVYVVEEELRKGRAA